MAVVEQVRERVPDIVKTTVNLFATPLTAAHYVELVNPLWSTRKLQAKVVEVRDETADARTLVLKPGRNWRRHRAGQHIRVGLSVGGRRYTRTYTLSSSPERRDGNITITVKILQGGRMSRELVREVEVGDHIPIGLPQGDFLIPEAKPVRPLFITGGSGITPIMSFLRTYDLIGNVPDIAHIHYAPHAYDVIFSEELRELQQRHPNHYDLHVVHTRELGDDRSHERHFTHEQLDELCPDWADREVWACGPQALLDDTEAFFAEHGMAEDFHVERFRAAMADLGEVEGGEVTFLVDGQPTTVEADGETPLLRVAEDAGLNPAHGCRMGNCHTCDSPLVEGAVRDLRNGRVISEQGDTVQVCISAAAGASTIDLARKSE